MKKRTLILMCILSLTLTGCWDSTELNDVSIVTGIAIDPGKEKRYRLTVGYVNASMLSPQQPTEGAPVSIMSLEGNSLPEISARMNIGVSRKLVFSHTRALYINEEVAINDGVGSFLDSLERNPQFRNDFNILITKGDPAEKFPTINDPVEKVPSLKVQKQVKSLLEGWGGDPRVRLTDFIDAIVSHGRSPVASSVTIKGDPEKGKNVESNMMTKAPARIMLGGIAVFKKDKLSGYLSMEDTRNYLWTQKLESTMVTIPCANHGKEQKEKLFFDLAITNNKSTIKAFYKGDQPHLKVDIYSEARLTSMQCKEDLSKKETYLDLEKKSSKYVKDMIVATIKKVQNEFGLDIFGFGEALYRQDYKKAKEVEDKWNEEFARADVDVNVHVAIRRSGIRGKSFLSELPASEEE
ncbi:Ger(x)C family spore germination protein [Robertmurraya sp. DFI.2.37]|uniref:Ger(x)C family spore germination protein n=1 Tax=Robertmurraya sp. DFI.2.37 TaxID=3031819 RepID=UPI001246E4E3|nr:Ger(x)C family spore germination protein [Robertmurraya sp. DFI.2.37]MDF1509553.1 Ger(x)C family spore germination protein [Robertmurraya sp. DFI.2.37]